MTLPIPIDWTTCSTEVDPANIDKIASVPTLSCLIPLITGFINWALIFAGIVAIFIVIYAGFKYINSSGDPKQADTARKTLIYAVFGLLLVLMSFFIVRMIGQVSGLEKDCYSMFGFSNCKSDSTSDSGSTFTPTPTFRPLITLTPTPTPLECKPYQDKKCSWFGRFCECVPKKCSTYGAVESECGDGRHYCNFDISDPTSMRCSNSNPCHCVKIPDPYELTCSQASKRYKNGSYKEECLSVVGDKNYCLPNNTNLYKFLNTPKANGIDLCNAPYTCTCKEVPQ